MQEKPTIKDLCQRAGLRLSELATMADLSPSSVWRMANGKPVTATTVSLALYILNQRLGSQYTPHDVDVELIEDE